MPDYHASSHEMTAPNLAAGVRNSISNGPKHRTEDVILPADSRCLEFDGLLLSPAVLEGIKKMGFVRPSPIQLEAIPVGRCGFDLVVQAKSGTGKTCVFSVIALESLNQCVLCLQVLILAPTREIVVQIADVIRSMGRAMPPFNCCTFIGGLPIAEDKCKVKNCQIAVGTPGRIKQLMANQLLKTETVRLFVLDEADKLLEEDFKNDINWIYHKLPSSKQMLAFSATYPEALAQMLVKYMQSPTFIRLNAKNPALFGIKQYYKTTPYHPLASRAFENKVSHVATLLSSLPFGQCMIFSNYQMRAQGLCDRLNALGWPATYICGKMSQMDRLLALSKFRDFKCRVLISTDLTARGIDIEYVNLVINLDVPYDVETYLHRIGRAGRFGTYGIVVTFATKGEEMQWLHDLKEKGNLKIGELPDQLNADLWHFKNSTQDSYSNSSASEKLKCRPSVNIDAEQHNIDEHLKSENQSAILGNAELVVDDNCLIDSGMLRVFKSANVVKEEISDQARNLKSLKLVDSSIQDGHGGVLTTFVTSSGDNISISATLDSTSNSCDAVKENISFVENDTDLYGLQTFLKTPSCEECAVCKHNMATGLTETAIETDSLFFVADRKMEEFLSIAHSKFFDEIKNCCQLFPESRNTLECSSIISNCAKVMNCLVPAVSESQHFIHESEEGRKPPKVVYPLPNTKTEQKAQTTMPSFQRDCEYKEESHDVKYTKRPPLVMKMKPCNASLSLCPKCSSNCEITNEEDICCNFHNASYEAHEKNADVKWSPNECKNLVQYDQWYQFIKMQKHHLWLHYYMKFMVSRRMHF